jgi:hypothetical protein
LFLGLPDFLLKSSEQFFLLALIKEQIIVCQVGGSFGVALFGTLLTRRIVFHSATYGIAVNRYSSAFETAMYNLEQFSLHAAGGSMYKCAVRGKALIVSHVIQQSFVSAVNDFLVAGAITIACIVPILFLRRRSVKNDDGRTMAST